MKFAQLIILALAFLLIKPASAGVLVEPVVGYSLGSFDPDDDFLTSDAEDLSGLSYGARLGYQKLGFQLGLDYLKSSLNIDNNDYSDLNASEWAGFVGFKFPMFFRLYAGYIFSATADTKYGVSNDKVELTKGTGSKFGIGFTGLPIVDINFEYRRGTFTEWEWGTFSGESDVNYSAYLISLSFPFVI